MFARFGTLRWVNAAELICRIHARVGGDPWLALSGLFDRWGIMDPQGCADMLIDAILDGDTVTAALTRLIEPFDDFDDMVVEVVHMIGAQHSPVPYEFDESATSVPAPLELPNNVVSLAEWRARRDLPPDGLLT